MKAIEFRGLSRSNAYGICLGPASFVRRRVRGWVVRVSAVFVITVFLAFGVWAKDGDSKPEVKVRGDFRVGFEGGEKGWFYNGKMQIINYDVKRLLSARVKYTMQLSPDLVGLVEFEGDADDPSIFIQDLGLEYEWNRNWIAAAGNLKKFFDLEEMTSRSERLTINRSLLYDLLSSMGIVGRDLCIQAVRKNPAGYRVFLNSGGDGDSRAFVNFRLARETEKPSLFGGALSYVYHYQRNNTLVGEIDYSRKWGPWYGDIEVVGGKDPNESELNELLNESRDVYFAGIKSTAARNFDVNWRRVYALEPVLLVDFIFTDTKPDTKIRTQYMPGVNIYLDAKRRVRWMTFLDLLVFNSGTNDDLLFRGYGIASQFQARW